MEKIILSENNMTKISYIVTFSRLKFKTHL